MFDFVKHCLNDYRQKLDSTTIIYYWSQYFFNKYTNLSHRRLISDLKHWKKHSHCSLIISWSIQRANYSIGYKLVPKLEITYLGQVDTVVVALTWQRILEP